MVRETVDSKTALPFVLPQVEMMDVRQLRPSERNARTHSKKQIRQVASSLKQFGFNSVVAIDQSGNIVAGHARVEAAKLLGLTRIPVVRLAHLNATEIRAFMLADNKLAEKAGWDRELLAAELRDLQLGLPELNLEISLTGFEPGEVDAILADFADAPAISDDTIPDVGNTAIARNGDLFVLGAHRILVGDAREPRACRTLLGSEKATMAFLDPPYNVKIHGHVGGRGKTKHREFACAAGEMSSKQFTEFLRQTLGNCAGNLADGAIAYVCMDWRHIGELLEAGTDVYSELKNVCVWNKTTPGQGSFYRSQHELIFVFKNGDSPHINTFELGQHGRTRTNVWTYPGVNSFRTDRMDELRMHPTVKPVALIADAMRDCSKRGSIVLDVFCGSGSTIIAAEQLGRRAFAMELDPLYADVAIRRWQQTTGKDAMLHGQSETFDELERTRAYARTKDRRKQGSPHA